MIMDTMKALAAKFKGPSLKITAGVIVIGLVFAAGFLTAKRGFTRVSITGPDGIGITLDGDTDYLEVLKYMYGHELLGPGMIGWLAEKSVYPIDKPELVEALGKDLCEPIPDDPMEELMAKGKACADLPVARGLRELARQRKPPFHYIGSPVRVSKQVEEPHRPQEGQANTCREGPFYRRNIQVRSPIDEYKAVEVSASSSYACPPNPQAHIQLNEVDMAKLFDGPVGETEDAYAFVLE